jgi:hypothetical protein
MEIISVGFNDEYKLVTDEINSLANELGISRSFILREIICEAFGFTPTKEMNLSKRKVKGI